MNKNGIILWRGLSKIDRQPIVAIATGMVVPSKNAKTGGIIQIFIIRDDINPINAIYSGGDKSICGNCPHRPENNGTCYVNVSKSVYNVYECYNRGNYPQWNGDLSIFDGKKVRFGAYGDPVLIPVKIVRGIVKHCKRHTGYTHQWHLPIGQPYKGIFMASVDNYLQAVTAVNNGWNYFRVKPLFEDYGNELPEKICYNETLGYTCEKCMQCDGKHGNIVITAHGKGAKNVK